ncbi:hypothetical protein SISNIDRAFT_487079 [Sistotremastrum niveocremeum HHB9708]|uniref:F-box domain-containing protein n=1 Tax=Sistotremastrum niveocremeum HHB9708 TaxID=1314777 RepID=A0A164SSG7_9AGAM|nr:hypothetical protein SISNIDRAFT_487079 [Sistotremastrum niveocremeum HHB9708]
MPKISKLEAIYREFETKVAHVMHQRPEDIKNSKAAVSATSFEHLLFQAEQRISRSIHSMRRQYNRRAPVNRLPNELILEILQYCMASENSHLSYDLRIPAAFSTCKRWRDIAISATCLWTKISLPMHPSLSPLLLERSGNRPVDVYLTNSPRWKECSLKTSLVEPFDKLVPRISSLSISWDDDIKWNTQTLNQFLAPYSTDADGCPEFSSLRFLKIWDFSDEEEQEAWLSTPMLEKLILHGNINSKPIVNMYHLVNLQVYWCIMSSADILGLLQDCVKLKTCYIENETPECRPASRRPWRCMLSCLETLTLHSLCVSDMHTLLDSLDIPSSTTIATTADEDFHLPPEIEPVSFVDLIGPRISEFEALTISHGCPGIVYDFTSDSDSRGFRSFEDNTSSPRSIRSLPALASYPNILNYLEIDVQTLPSSEDLAQALASWSGLTRLCITTQEEEFDKLVLVLQGEVPLLLPRLECFDCSETKFKRSSLLTFLQFRRDKGMAIKELVMTKGFSSPDAEGFAALVEKLNDVDPSPATNILFPFR